MFKALEPLLLTCASLSCTLIANKVDGTITVIVEPKGANAALNTPLSLTGTADEFDEQFAGMVGSYKAKRDSLSEQLAATEAILDAAKLESESKAAKAIKKGAGATGKAPKALPPDDDGSGDDDMSGDDKSGSAPAPVAPDASPAPANGASSSDNVWE